ncbi:MAG TPA: DNA translocase FtsK 4TM domain-containing protein, partial [Thermodesulfovibrionales bacterium]|nr:DNA translocase FtsK 4TM domain-containing protein [Thermodesulfovibrionales bacterium]
MTERLKRIRQEILGVVSILGSIYIALSLATYSKWDPSLFVSSTLPVQNYGGIVGSYLADFLVSGAGVVAVVIPIALVIYGVKKVLGKEGHWIYLLGFILFILSASMLASLLAATFHVTLVNNLGGIVGTLLSGLAVGLLSIPGAYIFSLALFFSSLILLSP